MTRLLVLLAVSLTAAASAQAPRNDTADVLAMGSVGLGTSALAFGIGATQDEVGVLVLAPVASAVTVSITGALRGRPGSLNGALGGAVLAAAPGALVALLDPPRDGRATTGAVIGSLLYVALPPAGAVLGFEHAAPKLIPLPTGEVVPGVALRASL